MRRTRKGTTLFLALLGLSGCVSALLDISPSLVTDMTRSFFEECDADLARDALPADLKLLEGLSRSAPNNRPLLASLSTGFTGYAMLFLEEDTPERASRFYLRALGYGALGLGLRPPSGRPDPSFEKAMAGKAPELARVQTDLFFWTLMAWVGWVNLNLDDPAALSQISALEACIEALLRVDPDLFHGTLFILKGALLSRRPKALGGDPEQARICFEKAIAESRGGFFLAHYFFAGSYAVQVQDRALFIALAQEVAKGNPQGLKDVCLLNSVMKKRMETLATKVDDLFL